jgi:hypothetical protein
MTLNSKNTTEIPAGVADLQKKWQQLNDMDRALAIHKAHQAGASFRSLANTLNCSEALLRQLNLAAQAPPPYQFLARHGRISTRELVRRAKANLALQANKEHQALEHQRMQACQNVCDSICNWLARERLFKSDGEQIIDDSRRSWPTQKQADSYLLILPHLPARPWKPSSNGYGPRGQLTTALSRWTGTPAGSSAGST